MELAQIILLAVALSIDAMVVSFSQGLIFKINKRKNSLLLAFFLGFFQGLMPIIGYFKDYCNHFISSASWSCILQIHQGLHIRRYQSGCVSAVLGSRAYIFAHRRRNAEDGICYSKSTLYAPRLGSGIHYRRSLKKCYSVMV